MLAARRLVNDCGRVSASTADRARTSLRRYLLWQGPKRQEYIANENYARQTEEID
jgi:hypothetical protein